MHHGCLARTNVDVDDGARDAVMRRHRLTAKRDAVNVAPRAVAAAALDLDRAWRR